MSSEFTSREFTSRTTSSWTILPIYRLIRDQGPICDGMEARVSLREFVTKPKQKPNVVTAGLDTEQKGEDNELEDIVVEKIEEHAVAHSRAELRNQLTSAANQEGISNEGQQVLRLLRDAGVEVEYVPDKNDSRISWPKLVPPVTNFNYNVVGKTGATLPQIVVRTDTFTKRSRGDYLGSDWSISDNLVALKVAATLQYMKFCSSTIT